MATTSMLRRSLIRSPPCAQRCHQAADPRTLLRMQQQAAPCSPASSDHTGAAAAGTMQHRACVSTAYVLICTDVQLKGKLSLHDTTESCAQSDVAWQRSVGAGRALDVSMEGIGGWGKRPWLPLQGDGGQASAWKVWNLCLSHSQEGELTLADQA